MTNKKQNNDQLTEMDNLMLLGEKPFIKVDKQEVSRYTVFLDEDIVQPNKYRDLTYLLMSSNEWDEFYFIINSHGGVLDSAVQIYHSLKITQANTYATLIGECDSAASIIAMACDNVQVLPYSSMLCHTATFGAGDFTSRVVDSVLHTEKYIKDFIYEVYEGFMTSEELDSLHTGKEFLLRSDEINRRLKAREEYFQHKNEQPVIPKVKAKKQAVKK